MFSGLIENGFELLHFVGMRCGSGEVGDFPRIGLVIIQFHTVFAICPFSITIAVGANGAAEGFDLAGEARQARADAGGAVGGLSDGSLGVGKQRREAVALEMFGLRQITEIGEGGVKIDEFGE